MAEWNEVPCPACKKPVAFNATKCPYCQLEYTSEQQKARAGQLKGSIGCAVALLLVLALALGYCVYGGGDSVPEEAGPTAKADALALYQNVRGAAQECDQAGDRVAAAANTSDAVAVYGAADTLEAACLSVPSKIREIEVPASLGRALHEQFTGALKDCEDAYLAKWSTAGKLKEALDNSGSVAAQAELRQYSDAVVAGQTQCAMGLAAAELAAGVSAEELR